MAAPLAALLRGAIRYWPITLGGLFGAAVLGQIFDRQGWGSCVAAIALSLALAAVLASRLKTPGLQPVLALAPRRQ